MSFRMFCVAISSAVLLACSGDAPPASTGGKQSPPASAATSATVSETIASPGTPATGTSQSSGVAAQRSAAQRVVEEFGRRMRNVSTLASPAEVAKSLRQQYADLVVASLLARWVAEPATAPGRQVSSPWPDHIEVQRVSDDQHGVVVDGVLVEMTSSGEAARKPVRVSVENREGKWRISGYETRAVSSGGGDGASDDAAAAVEVLKTYYTAIEARDFERAWRCWGPNGAPGQTFDRFKNGFADTASVSLKTGSPSGVGAAAGSRYIEVPVTIESKKRDGRTQKFEGTYTLRRVVVDGATEAQRQWHLEQAKLRRVTGPGRKPRSEGE